MSFCYAGLCNKHDDFKCLIGAKVRKFFIARIYNGEKCVGRG